MGHKKRTRSGPLLLDAAAIERALDPTLLLAAIEASLVALDRAEIALAPTLHLPGLDGGFHVKSAYATHGARRAVVKLNGNFPENPARHGLPTIQGVVALLDLELGCVLALLDSIALTASRTAAVSAVAARRLARGDARVLALVGCGVQGRAHLDLLVRDFRFAEVRLFDRDPDAAARLERRSRELGLPTSIVASAPEAARGAEVVVTSTSATAPLLDEDDVDPGAFVAAVGADNPTKNELAPALLSRSRVLVDSLASASANGDLRSAIAAGEMTADDVHGELPALLAGRIAGRASADERWIFDSTGLAATDLAAASLAYDAVAGDLALPRFEFAQSQHSDGKRSPV